MTNENRDITEQDKEFVECFLAYNHAGKAYDIAYPQPERGRKSSSAYQAGRKKLEEPLIREYLKKRKEEHLDSLYLTQEKVLMTILESAMADPKDLLDKNGFPLELKDLPEYVSSAIQSIDIFTREDEDGTKSVQYRIKFVDKNKSRDMLMRYMNLYEKDNQSKTGLTDFFEQIKQQQKLITFNDSPK